MVKGTDIRRELQRTHPDYVVYVPGSMDGSTHDTGNEHFLVFDGPDGNLMVVWTQSTREGMADQRIAFSKSKDEGASWARPKIIAGPKPPAEGGLCSWGFPLVAKSGRIYVLYSKHIGVNDWGTHTTGLMAGICSDDMGAHWSGEQLIAMRRSKWDNPDESVPANWIVWQKPERLSGGKYLGGFTRWVSPSVRHAPPNETWTAAESVVEFMRWENIDDDPEVKNIKISNFMVDDEALRVGHPQDSQVSLVQEPSTVKLPDGRLFCVMRTATGHPYYTVSGDRGETWDEPAVLKYDDNSVAFRHPCSPCPIYPLDDDGRYMFLYHNHDGHFGKWDQYDSTWHRRPLYAALGEFREAAKQPIWFSGPKFLMDNAGVALGYEDGRADLAMYASLTNRSGRRILWYPERKFFLLGRNITDQWLAGLEVPGM